MKINAEFVPKHLEKAVDLARNIATFAYLEFTAGNMRMRLVDPGKVVFMDMIFVPDIYKCDEDFKFGINLQMFFKLLRSLDNNETVEIEADAHYMKIIQLGHVHTLVSQELPLPETYQITDFRGYKVQVNTKTFQRYLRALGAVANVAELHYVPASDTLFMESVNSLYRTTFAMDTSATQNQGEDEYRKSFMVKFLEMAIHPGLATNAHLVFGENAVVVEYFHEESCFNTILTVAGYTEA